MKKKVREWVNRYALPTFLGIAATILVGNFVRISFGDVITAAFLSTWADNIVFYLMICYRDLRATKHSGHRWSCLHFLKVLRNMIMEFGPAEYLDSFVLRPFFLSVFPYLIRDYSAALFVGSVCAEVTYFVPTILSYEIRKKTFKD